LEERFKLGGRGTIAALQTLDLATRPHATHKQQQSGKQQGRQRIRNQFGPPRIRYAGKEVGNTAEEMVDRGQKRLKQRRLVLLIRIRLHGGRRARV